MALTAEFFSRNTIRESLAVLKREGLIAGATADRLREQLVAMLLRHSSSTNE